MRGTESWGMNRNYLSRDLRKKFCASAPKRAPAIAIARMKATFERVSVNQKQMNVIYLAWSDSAEAACRKKSRRLEGFI